MPFMCIFIPILLFSLFLSLSDGIFNGFTTLRFDYVHAQNDAAKYLRDISNIFAAKIRRECADDCNAADVSQPIFIQIHVQSNMSDITWSTDEGYRLDITTEGNCANITQTNCPKLNDSQLTCNQLMDDYSLLLHSEFR